LLSKDPAHRPDASACLEVVGQIRAHGPSADPATEPEEQETDTVHPVALELRPGDVLDGYIVEQELGRGGMGITYACRDGSDTRFALKVAGFKFKSAERAREQMRRDAEHAARIPDHPAIAKVHGLGETEVRGVPVVYLCCELVMGPSLSRLVDRYGPIPPRALQHLWVSVVEGVKTIHDAGILHLDLKPGNVLLDRHVDAERPLEPQLLEALPKIIDFGISRRLEDAPDTSTGLEGTPYYMSPEQCEGLAPGRASDIYTLGTTFFQLATGAPPFIGEQLAVINQQVTSAPPVAELKGRLGYHLSLVLSRCLLKDPAERYSDATELLEHLCLAGERGFPRRELEYVRDREHLVLSGTAPRRAPPSSSHKHLRMRSEGFEQLGQILSAVSQLEPTRREAERTTSWLEQHLDELREVLLDDPGRATVELEVIFKVLVPRVEQCCAQLEGERASILSRLQALDRDARALVAICELRARTLTEDWREASAALERLDSLEDTQARNRLVRVRVERDLDQRLTELRWDLREATAKIDGLLASGKSEWAAQELLSFERRHPHANEVAEVVAVLEELRERVAQDHEAGRDSEM
jgi:serine/threonine protein kinase